MWFCCQLWKCKFKTCFAPLDLWKAWSHVVYPSKTNSTPSTFLDSRVGEEHRKRNLFPHRQGLSRSQDSPTAAFPHSEPEVNVEHILDYYADDALSLASDTDNESLKLQYREIWELRATLAEDEGNAPTNMVEEDAEPYETSQVSDQKIEPEQPEVFEPCTRSYLEEPSQWPLHLQELPSYEARRQTYRSILAWRTRRPQAQIQQSGSFNTIDTLDTTNNEDLSTEVSQEVSESFETAEGYINSSVESQGHRLQQLRHDSGYKSLENPPGSALRLSQQLGESTDVDGFYPSTPSDREKDELQIEEQHELGLRMKRGELRLGSLGDSGACDVDFPVRNLVKDSQHPCFALGSSNERDHDEGVAEMQSPPAAESPVVEERRKSCDRTASKKRREFVSGRGAMALIYPDVDYHPRYSSIHSYSRDYSVDEKSDALFREFSRFDPSQTEIHPRQRLGGSGYRRHQKSHHSRHSHFPYPEPAQHSSIDEECPLPQSLDLIYTFHEAQSTTVPVIRVADED